MLSVSHWAGTPFIATMSSLMRGSRSSRVTVMDLRKKWRLDHPSVEV